MTNFHLSNLKQVTKFLQTKNHFSINLYARSFSLQRSHNAKDNYKLVVIGGGSGGLSTAAKFVRKLGKNNVAVIDPSDWHYYQAGWTLVGGGIKTAESMRKPQQNLIPAGVDWIKNHVSSVDPDNNTVTTNQGEKIKYDYLIVATGINIDFDHIKGFKEALKQDDQSVVSIYSHEYVQKVFPAIQNFKGGNAIFTFPMMPIKCPGAPQKIMYLAEDYFRKNNIRNKANVNYYTTLPVIFGVKKYADSLMEIVKKRDINLRTRKNLIEVDYKNKLAIFEDLDKPGSLEKKEYSLLHVCPPMKPVKQIAESKLADSTGFVDVVKETLQHKKYQNVFGIGDCTNMSTKTAAAVAAQSGVLFKNLDSVMKGNQAQVKYDGYTSCPLVTGYGKLILAEFDFDGKPLETFPIDQSKERYFFYSMKKDVMPDLYWYGLLKGIWNGPAFFRKAQFRN